MRCQIRVKFHFVQLTPKNANAYVFLLESYDFRVFMQRLSRLHLHVTSNKGSIKVKYNFVQLTPKNANSFVFLLESFLSPHKVLSSS